VVVDEDVVVVGEEVVAEDEVVLEIVVDVGGRMVVEGGREVVEEGTVVDGPRVVEVEVVGAGAGLQAAKNPRLRRAAIRTRTGPRCRTGARPVQSPWSPPKSLPRRDFAPSTTFSTGW
jgi:hypothetical protein